MLHQKNTIRLCPSRNKTTWTLLHYLTENCPLNRNLRKTPAHYYSNFYNTLPPTPHNTSLRAHIHTHFANRSIYSMQPKTILNSYPSPISIEEKNPLARREGLPIPTLVQVPPSVALLHTQDQPYKLRHMHPLQQRRGHPRTHSSSPLYTPPIPQKQIQHTITRTPLETPCRSLQLPARWRGDPEHTHYTPTNTITQPFWWDGGDFPSKAGEAALAAGGAILEDPPGINYYYYLTLTLTVTLTCAISLAFLVLLLSYNSIMWWYDSVVK